MALPWMRPASSVEKGALNMTMDKTIFCECENAHCTLHAEDLGHIAATARVETIYGPFNICAACTKAHPIPAEFLKEAAQ
jgi:hypothetical protein